jgi:hypothetical protein
MKYLRLLRYWLIRILVGKMVVIANANISNWDFYDNLEKCKQKNKSYMLYGNDVYVLERRIHEKVFTGNKGKVLRRGNSFTLEV